MLKPISNKTASVLNCLSHNELEQIARNRNVPMGRTKAATIKNLQEAKVRLDVRISIGTASLSMNKTIA